MKLVYCPFCTMPRGYLTTFALEWHVGVHHPEEILAGGDMKVPEFRKAVNEKVEAMDGCGLLVPREI